MLFRSSKFLNYIFLYYYTRSKITLPICVEKFVDEVLDDYQDIMINAHPIEDIIEDENQQQISKKYNPYTFKFFDELKNSYTNDIYDPSLKMITSVNLVNNVETYGLTYSVINNKIYNFMTGSFTEYIYHNGFAILDTDSAIYDLLNGRFKDNEKGDWKPNFYPNSQGYKYPRENIQEGGLLPDDLNRYITYDNVLKLYDCTNKKYFNKCLKFPIKLLSVTDYLRPKDSPITIEYPKCLLKLQSGGENYYEKYLK